MAINKYRLREILSMSRRCHPKNAWMLPCMDGFAVKTNQVYCGFLREETRGLGVDLSMRPRLKDEGLRGVHWEASRHKMKCKTVRVPWFPLLKHNVCAYYTKQESEMNAKHPPRWRRKRDK